MSAVRELKASARERVGKGGAREVRRQGRVPAVIYGAGAGNTTISLDANQMRQLIFAGHFLTSTFEIDVDGTKTRVVPREYQLDPVKDLPLHVDFLRVAAGQTLNIEVPVHFVGHDEAPGLKRGGTLNIVRHSIELVVPTDAMPDAIEADISGLDIGDSLHISAMKLPEGVRPVVDRDFTVATVAVPAGFNEADDTAAAADAPAAG